MTKTHGMTKTSIYNVWQAMRSRCQVPTNPAYPNYGGRGITVCDRWLKFENFLEDMGERPFGKSLDRKDNSKGYSKDNCQWASRLEQGQNMRSNKLSLDKACRIIYLRKYKKPRMKIKWICWRYGIKPCTVHAVVNGETWPQAQTMRYRVRERKKYA